MKQFLGVLAGLAVLATAPSAQAQSAIDLNAKVTINSLAYGTGVRGFPGGFGVGLNTKLEAVFPDPTKTLVFDNFLAWCIDPNRSVTIGGTFTFQLWSLADFAASSLSPVGPKAPNPLYDPNLSDMTRAASFANQMQTNWGALGGQTGSVYGSLWSVVAGFTTYGNLPGESSILAGDPNFDIDQWYVLYNGGNQTLIGHVPEPSGVMTLVLALGGLLIVALRRRSII